MKKLYVGNLSYDTSENGLASAFEKFAPIVSVRIISDKFSGQSRGFGFVEIESDDMAVMAINEMDGFELDGKQLKVNEARPQEERSGGGHRGGGFRSGGGRREGGGGRREGGFGSDRGGRREGGFGSDRGGRGGRRDRY